MSEYNANNDSISQSFHIQTRVKYEQTLSETGY